MSRYNHIGNYKQQIEYKESIRKRDNYTCQLCGNPGYDVDHIIPWSISHDSSTENLRVLCHSCNCKLRGKRNLPNGFIHEIPVDEYEDYLRNELSFYE